MPPRVREGHEGAKTTGYADGEIGLPFTSGSDQTWTPSVLERARAAGVPQRLAVLLSRHVEGKVAASMLQRGKQHSELVINHAPCGSQPHQKYSGCHQALERFLPEGQSLTVHGTTQQGSWFSHTYYGKGRP